MKVVQRASNIIFYPLVALLLLTTALIIIQPEGSQFRIFTNNAVEFLLGILGFSLLCMLLRWHKLMFTAFGCVGVLCFFLKSSSNPEPIYAAPSQAIDFEVFQLNIQNHDWNSYEELSDLLIRSSADVISIQEVTPDWDFALMELLQDSFPYSISIPTISFNGLAVYSKHPILETDTFYHKDTPNISGLVKVSRDNNHRTMRFVSTYTSPTFNSDKSYSILKEHFSLIIDEMKERKEALTAFGSFNTVAWSSEMKFFTNMLGLQNSKRSLNPFSLGSYEHIFHSKHLECSDFDVIYSENGDEIGIKATLQFKNTIMVEDAKEI